MMETSSFADDLRGYLNLIRRWLWLLVLVTLLCGAAAYGVSLRITPIFEAVTTVLINQAPSANTSDYTALVTSERLTQTYAQLMTKQPVLRGVIESQGLVVDVEELEKAITVQPVTDTTLIEVRVEDADAQQAAAIANELVAQFSTQNEALQSSRYAESKAALQQQLDQINEQIQLANTTVAALGNSAEDEAERDRQEANLAQYRQTYAYILQSYEQVRLAEAQSTSNVIQAEPASVPDKPVRPRKLLNTALAMIVGLLLSTGGVFLVDALDDTLKSPDDVVGKLGLPVLGVIARHEVEEGVPVTLAQPRSPVSEAFRSLRTNTQFASVDKPLKTLLVTSPSPAEGKSTVAVNLGVVMAQSGKKVLVVDADLRRPRVHRVLGLKNQLGISNLFVQAQPEIQKALQATAAENLVALSAGDLPPNPSELLGSEKMLQILELAKENAGLVIIDTPPVMAVTDSAILAPKVDGVLVVVKPGVTQMAVAQQTVELLLRGGANVIGVVLNDVNLVGRRSYYYKGYYYASRSYTHEETGARGISRWFKRSSKNNHRT